MARLARVVVPEAPHHITQRGNHRQDVFFEDADRRMYLEILRDHCRRAELRILAYCLMSNHVHLVVIPQRSDSLAKGLGRTHNEFARWMHVRTRQSGHLWQNRFFSCPLDDRHLQEALRYVELNPVRANLTPRAWDWPWSSAAAHVSGTDSGELLDLGWWRGHCDPGRWREVLELGTVHADLCERLRESTRTGRPFGDPGFVETIESRLNRTLRPKPPGRKPSVRAAGGQLDLGIA